MTPSSTRRRTAAPGTDRAERLRPVQQPHTEVFIGLVAPIGTNLGAVTRELEKQLRPYDYRMHHIGLSDFLGRLTWSALEDLPKELASGIPDRPFDERVWACMTAGNVLRETWQYAGALALLGVSAVEDLRQLEAADDVSEDELVGWPTVDRRAYVFRSLKNAGEVTTFREIYGPRFLLIGAHCSEGRRVNNLKTLIAADRRGEPPASWPHAPSHFIDRDWAEETETGQDVSGTFHQADFFIDAEERSTIRRDLTRVLRVMFGDPHQTPTREEYGMFQAWGGALRSGELGRQVGAAVATSSGSVVALGTNEVPASGGGSYWTGDPSDARESTKDKDTNQEHKEEIALDVEQVVRKHVEEARASARAKPKQSGANASKLRDLLSALSTDLQRRLPSAVLRETRLRDLTEFHRATHAEMSALLDAARRGISVQDGTIFVSTFPCHSCAKGIVEAGLRRVVFVEPYAKSRALEMHRDSVALVSPQVESSSGEDGSTQQTKVRFEPFIGVAPRRYLTLFDAWYRRAGYLPRALNGEPIDFDERRHEATPVFTDRESGELQPEAPVYKYREGRALRYLEDRMVEKLLRLATQD